MIEINEVFDKQVYFYMHVEFGYLLLSIHDDLRWPFLNIGKSSENVVASFDLEDIRSRLECIYDSREKMLTDSEMSPEVRELRNRRSSILNDFDAVHLSTKPNR